MLHKMLCCVYARAIMSENRTHGGNKMEYKIDTKEFVQIGGIPQNIRIRTSDTTLPVLLFLHGGPGVCDRFWVIPYQSGLADCATLVCWDQRCAGLTYNSKENYDGLTVGRMVEDAAELILYLKKRFHKEKIFLVGHSWGSLLGVLVAQKYPEHIAAYIGMGQFVDGPENEILSYQFVLEEAKKRGNKKAVKALEKVGWPQDGKYRSQKDMMTQRKYLGKFGGGVYKSEESTITSIVVPILKSPEYNIFEVLRYAKGSMLSLKLLWEQVVAHHLCESVKKLEVPVYLTQGRHDQNTPVAIAQKWFDALKAPSKQWIWFENSAHSPIKEEAATWQATVREIINAEINK